MEECSHYCDSRVLAIDHTLIRFKANSERVGIPSSFGGYPVTVVGPGSVNLGGVRECTFEPGYSEFRAGCLFAKLGEGMLERLSFPETVRTIPNSLFPNNGKHSGPRITHQHLFIARALDPDVFYGIRRGALPVGKNVRLVPYAMLGKAKLGPVVSLLRNCGEPTVELNGNQGTVFFGELPETKTISFYQGTVFDSRRCFDFDHGRQRTEEHTVVMEMIREGNLGWHDEASEREADLRIRVGLGQLTCSVPVALCEGMSGEPGPDGKYHVTFHVFGRSLFVPALRYVRHRGKDWWVYSRNYLNGNPEQPYWRRDVGVFDRDGLVIDRKTSEDVYAKVRFLSLL